VTTATAKQDLLTWAQAQDAHAASNRMLPWVKVALVSGAAVVAGSILRGPARSTKPSSINRVSRIVVGAILARSIPIAVSFFAAAKQSK